jgi:hypothetical protein
MKNAKRIEKLRKMIAAQEAHTRLMISVDPEMASIPASKRIAYVFRAELQHLEAGKTRTSFDLNAATAEARAVFGFNAANKEVR